jgi:hypothetical protein
MLRKVVSYAVIGSIIGLGIGIGAGYALSTTAEKLGPLNNLTTAHGDQTSTPRVEPPSQTAGASVPLTEITSPTEVVGVATSLLQLEMEFVL